MGTLAAMIPPAEWKPYVCVLCARTTRLGPTYADATKAKIAPSICVECFPPTLEGLDALRADVTGVSEEVRAYAEKVGVPPLEEVTALATWCMSCPYCNRCYCDSKEEVGGTFLCAVCDAVLCVRHDTEHGRRLEIIPLVTVSDVQSLIRSHGTGIWKAAMLRALQRPFRQWFSGAVVRLGQYALFRRTLLRGHHWELKHVRAFEGDERVVGKIRAISRKRTDGDGYELWCPMRYCEAGYEATIRCECAPVPFDPHRVEGPTA